MCVRFCSCCNAFHALIEAMIVSIDFHRGRKNIAHGVWLFALSIYSISQSQCCFLMTKGLASRQVLLWDASLSVRTLSGLVDAIKPC